jgi:hypothetical protein
MWLGTSSWCASGRVHIQNRRPPCSLYPVDQPERRRYSDLLFELGFDDSSASVWHFPADNREGRCCKSEMVFWGCLLERLANHISSRTATSQSPWETSAIRSPLLVIRFVYSDGWTDHPRSIRGLGDSDVHAVDVRRFDR